MLQLGDKLGEGAHGLVVEAEAGPSVGSFSRLAVKMVPAEGTRRRAWLGVRVRVRVRFS